MFGKVILCILLGFISIAEIRATQVQSCPNLPNFMLVDILDCDQEPCILYNGTSVSINLVFGIPAYTTKLKPTIRVTLDNGISMTIPLIKDACTGLVNGYCPVYEGEVLLYHFSLPLNGYPEISFVMEFKLNTDDSLVIGCFKVRMMTVTQSSEDNLLHSSVI